MTTTNPQRASRPIPPSGKGDERGQTTSEYALVLLAAGTIAMLVVGWAQGSDAIGMLFDAVLERITNLMG